MFAGLGAQAVSSSSQALEESDQQILESEERQRVLLAKIAEKERSLQALVTARSNLVNASQSPSKLSNTSNAHSFNNLSHPFPTTHTQAGVGVLEGLASPAVASASASALAYEDRPAQSQAEQALLVDSYQVIEEQKAKERQEKQRNLDALRTHREQQRRQRLADDAEDGGLPRLCMCPLPLQVFITHETAPHASNCMFSGPKGRKRFLATVRSTLAASVDQDRDFS